MRDLREDRTLRSAGTGEGLTKRLLTGAKHIYRKAACGFDTITRRVAHAHTYEHKRRVESNRCESARRHAVQAIGISHRDYGYGLSYTAHHSTKILWVYRHEVLESLLVEGFTTLV